VYLCVLSVSVVMLSVWAMVFNPVFLQALVVSCLAEWKYRIQKCDPSTSSG
jgi:hypothetical protein